MKLGNCILLVLMAMAVPLSGNAESYPQGPITIIVPFKPGGPVDLIPRTVAAKMSDSLGVPIVIENRPGAGGNIGAAAVAKAQPDGQTLLAFAGGVLTVNPWIYKNAPFNAEKDFAPITNFASTPNVIVVSPGLPVDNLKELIKMVKAKPGTLNYSSPGVGTTPHMCMEKLRAQLGLDYLHVPYKSGPEAVRDLLTNRVQITCSNLTPVLAYVRSGKLKALAVTSKTRSAAIPDVPTAEEAGVPGFEVLGWFGLAAPAGTPRDVIAKLNSEVRKAMDDPATASRLKSFGVTPIGDSPEHFASFIAAESAQWRKVVEQAHVVLN